MKSRLHTPVAVLLLLPAMSLAPCSLAFGEEGAEEEDVNVQLCEQKLKEIHGALEQYVAQKGSKRFYPASLVELVKAGFLDAELGLRCPADASPELKGNVKVSYQSAFDLVTQRLTTSIPEVRPLVWDKPGTHKNLNFVLLASGRVLRIKDEAYFRDFVGGWANKTYLKKVTEVETATEDLMAKLRDDPESLNLEEAIRALAVRGPMILQEIFKQLAWSIPEQKAIIIMVVKEMEAAAESILIEDLKSPDVTTRTRALELLGELKSAAVIERYTKMLKSEYPSVRLQAIAALGLLRDKATIPTLMALAVSSEDPKAQKEALIALAGFAGPEAKPVFQEPMVKGDLETRMAIARYMARVGDASALNQIQRLIREVQAEQKTEVLAILVSLGSQEAFRTLRTELRPPPVTPPERVLAALLTIRDLKLKQFVGDAIPLLGYNHPDIQASAARTLGELGDRAALPELRKLKEATKFHRVTRAAVGAITTLEEFGPTTPEKESPETGDTIVILADNTPVYAGKEILANVNKGNLFKITGKQNNWFSISVTKAGSQAVTGWVSDDKFKIVSRMQQFPYLATTRVPEGKVMYTSNVVTALPEGAIVTVYEEREGWFNVYAIHGKWGFAGWMAAGDIRPIIRPSESVTGLEFRQARICGLPRFNEPGAAMIAFSPDNERFAVASKGGRVEILETYADKKLGEATVGPPVLAMGYHPERKTLMVSSSEAVEELTIEEEKVKTVKSFNWLLEDLKVVSILPGETRGVFPFAKETEEGKSWRLAVEDYEAEKLKGPRQPKEGSPPAAKDKPQAAPPARPPEAGPGQGPPTRKPGADGAAEPPEPTPAEKPAEGQEKPEATVTASGKPEYASVLSRGVVILKDPSVPVRSLLAAPTGLFCLAVRRSMIDVVDLVKMQVLGSLEAGTRGITDLAMSPNTLYVAAGGEDEIVRIWETSSQKLRIIVRPKSGKISAIAFAPDSQVFAICTANGDLQLWDLFTEQMMQKLRHQGTASVVQFSPDGRAIVVGNTDSTVAVYTR